MFKSLNRSISTPIAIIIIVLCALLVGGIVVYQYYEIPIPKEKEEAPETIKPPENETPEDETADWKTYRNEEYGFEVKCPDNYIIKEEATDDHLSKIKILSPEITVEFKTSPTEKIQEYKTNLIKIDINIYSNSNNLPLNQWLDGIGSSDYGPMFDEKYRREISINGIRGIHWYSGCCGGCQELIYLPDDKVIYNFALLGGSPGGSQLCEGDICKTCDICCFGVSGVEESIFNQMFSTFRFFQKEEPYIKILSPNGGEIFEEGQNIPITWISEEVNNVYIHAYYYDENNNIGDPEEFSFNSGECRLTYEPVSAATGRYITGGSSRCGKMPAGDRIKIEVRGQATDIKDRSDDYFSIVAE